MNNDQKLTPKYWVAHDKNSDDVFLKTASKDREEVQESLFNFLSGDWDEETSQFGIILIEIRICEL